MEETQEFYYHHSSHGSITLHKLLVDKDRREKAILLKYGITPGQWENVEAFYNISYSQLLERAKAEIGEEGIQSLFLKHREEMGQIPLVDHIMGVPYGKRMEVVVKVRGQQGHSVITGDFSSDPGGERFSHEEYHNYITIHALGNQSNIGIVYNVTLHNGDLKKVFFDIDQGIAVNVPNILHDYIAEFNVGFLELFKDDDEPDDTLHVSSDESGDPIRYAGASPDLQEPAFLHSFSPDSTELSAINMFINGNGNNNWDGSIYKRYFGFKREIEAETEKIVLTIFGSHCLNLQEFEEYGDIGNVIPFMIDSTPEWCEMFKKDLYEAAKEEVVYQNYELEELKGELHDLEKFHDEGELNQQDVVLDMTRMLRNSSDQYLLRPRSDSYNSNDLSDIIWDLSIDKDEISKLQEKIRVMEEKVGKAKMVHKALKTIQKKELGPIQSTKRIKKKKKDLSVKPKIKKKSKRKKKDKKKKE
jgi:hypothetical protein